MKLVNVFMLLAVVFILAMGLVACGGGGNTKGACTHPAAGCGDDFTKGECSLINGNFHPGATC